MRQQNLVCSLSTGGVSAGSPVAGTEFATPWRDRLRILEDYRRIAMVGLSANPYRPSHFAARYLIAEGYDVIPVNPREEEILGRRSYGSVKDVPPPVEVVDIFRASKDVPPIVEEAIEVGAKIVWMQFGIIHFEAAKRAKEAGLEVVMDQCMKVEHARFFGRLNIVGLNSGVVSSRHWKPGSGRKT